MSAPAPSVYSPAAKQIAESNGLVMGRPNLEVFAETMLEMAAADPNIVAVTSDSRGSGKLVPFAKQFPEQLIEVGIAEQNLVGVTAGLAACGKKSFGVSPSCFLTTRALEQIKNDICYSDVPAVLVGISAGVSYGALGTTHHSLHDLAALRAIHNLTSIVPADNFEAREAIRAAVEAKHPVYVRYGKVGLYDLPRISGGFQVGKASMLKDGKDLALIATGETVAHAFLAALALESQGLSVRVLSFHTVKPLDVESVVAAGRDCQAVLTVEEHHIHGGLGEACAAVLMQQGIAASFSMVGIPDEETVNGSQADIFRHYGISMEGLVNTALKLLEKK